MTASIAIEIDNAAFQAVDAELAKLDMMVRGPAMNQAIRDVGKMISQRTKAVLPAPGYVRYTRPKQIRYTDKSGPKPLGDTVGTKILNSVTASNDVVITGLIGYTRPAGSHGHLVERGHDLVKGGKKNQGGVVIGFVEPAEYMVKVVATTKQEQSDLLINGVRKALKVRA